MKIERKWTRAGEDVFESVEWTKRSSRISNLDGSVVFEMNDAEVPAGWSQLATDIMVSKYFRKAGVPERDPETGEPVTDEAGNPVTGPERSARQVIHRLAGCWRHWGLEHGYFDSAEDADAFYDELAYMMLNQMCAPNSPQWFNTGLAWAYGINGPSQGHYYTDPRTGQTRASEDAYTHPQPHACFIQGVSDDLVNAGGIMDLWTREARLFKYGSGTGTNFSRIRGENEPLSGGGQSSGLMSWLKIGDRAAGAIKSGGTTRRAAKMVCLDLDHPDIEHFVDWKVREEIKVAALVEGLKHLPEVQRRTARELGLELDYDFNGEAYMTVSGQNSNNSVRIPAEFFDRLDAGDDWPLYRRTDGELARTLPAERLWEKVAYAAWRSADPGVQFDSTINAWHTCPASGRIMASNPCSEYMFLDNTACNLASLNLIKFFDPERRHFDVEAFEHGVRLWTLVLEISVLMAQYPSEEIARLSYEYRTLGLGFANLGSMLMQAGIPYDSERGRSICGCVSAILTGRAYRTSAEIAAELGPFPAYAANAEGMLRVIRNHRRAAHGVRRDPDRAAEHPLGGYEGLSIPPVPIDAEALTAGGTYGTFTNAGELAERAAATWDEALELGREHGFRNAQATVIAPTGTIGLLMDCDTTGVEPDFALVKFKKLAGGGHFKIANRSVEPALESLGYTPDQVRQIIQHVSGCLTLDVPVPAVGENDESDIEQGHESFAQWLREKGLREADLKKLTDLLPTVFQLSQAFAPFQLGEETLDRLGLLEAAGEPGFDLLRSLGLSAEQVAALDRTICGMQTVEGAPHLAEAHLPVFDCASTCGPTGTRSIGVEGHIRMMAASQPFISGAISKTINLPHSASVEDIKQAYRLSWELGLKANALYRDGCKLSQVLSNGVQDEDPEDEENVEAGREAAAEDAVEVAGRVAEARSAQDAEPVERVVERVVERPLRRRLPDTRKSITHKFNVAGHEGYLTVGLYEDGTPGELFITMAKEGSTIGGLMDSLGTAISVSLQYGVPVESLVSKFTHQRFEPAGMSHNPDIPFAKSLVDYIFRWMGMVFVEGYHAANAPRRAGGGDPGRGKAAARASDRGERAAEAPPATARRERDSEAAPAPGPGAGGEGEKPGAAGSAGDDGSASTLAAAMSALQTDAPACDVCGTITVRNGTCYKCLNCGNSMGCS